MTSFSLFDRIQYHWDLLKRLKVSFGERKVLSTATVYFILFFEQGMHLSHAATDTKVTLYCCLEKRLPKNLVATWTHLSMTVRIFKINVWLLTASFSKRTSLHAYINQYIHLWVYSRQLNTHILLETFCYLLLVTKLWAIRIQLFLYFLNSLTKI